jgi:hypothetical protein
MATRSQVALKTNSDTKEVTCPVALEKRTSAAEAVKVRLFTARLKPCPSLGGYFLVLLGSSKAPALAKLASLKGCRDRAASNFQLNTPASTSFCFSRYGRYLLGAIGSDHPLNNSRIRFTQRPLGRRYTDGTAIGDYLSGHGMGAWSCRMAEL